MTEAWPFDQPPNCAVVTSRHVMRDGKMITHVYHDEDDHGWQFHSFEGTSMEDAMLVALKEVVMVDPSVLEVATLPPGWMAKRAPEDGVWMEQHNPDNSTEIVVDWENVSSEDAFFDLVLPQCDAPLWHGRNLNALRDSWIVGAINGLGPPYSFRFSNSSNVASDLKEFRDVVHEIARASVAENGGRIEEAKQ